MEIEVNRTAHADQRHYAAYRDINAAGNHYKAHPTGGNDQRRLGIQNVKKGLRLQKTLSLENDRPDIHGEKYNYRYRQKQIGIRHIF